MRKARNMRPYAPKVEKVELSDRNVKVRIIVTVALIVTGALLITLAVWQFTKKSKGWQTVDPGSVKGYSYSGEIRLDYCFGERKGVSATAEYKALQTLYHDALNRACPLFDADLAYTDVHNLQYINRHINETLTVDEILYHAFEQIAAHGDRTMYLAPVYETYRNVYASEADAIARNYDPYRSEEAAGRYAQFAAYAADPSMIDLQLLGENKIKLFVSDEYRAFAQNSDVQSYIDLRFISNAVIIDYCADKLISAGYTNGYLESYDGFIKNLDDGGKSRTIEFWQLLTSDDPEPVKFSYDRAVAAVDLHAYPKNSLEKAARFYTCDDGTVLTDYLDTSDGKSRTAVRELFAYSYEKSCTEIALSVLPFYTEETLDNAGIEQLTLRGIYCIYGSDGRVIRTDTAA